MKLSTVDWAKSKPNWQQYIILPETDEKIKQTTINQRKPQTTSALENTSTNAPTADLYPMQLPLFFPPQ